MKMLNAWTMELDEPGIAVSEILDQLDLDTNALGYSVGLISCSYDYVESGIVKAVCDALPFNVAGCTTLTNANNEEADTMLLCLTVMTADDCQFAAAVTGPLQEDLEGMVQAAVREAGSSLDETAKLALAFIPMFAMAGLGGEIILDSLDRALEDVPIFGTVACDSDTATYHNTYTIFNGECFRDCLSFILLAGNVNPRFVVTSTSEHNLRKQQAVITSSVGSLLKQVNDMTAKEYFESIGLIAGKGVEGMSSIPFVVDYNDGTQPVARAIYGFNEDGSAVCGGVMPEGGSLSIGRMDVEDILLTAETSLLSLLAGGETNGVIMFPCLGRNMVLAMDPMAETDVVKSCIGSIPWHLVYSGGECCPVYRKDAQPINRFHNFTFIGCAL
ncbi:MAG: FIST C-terminal domain-containing protein [Coriobacteriia bacterium]|nr:FIST C-terminal domain-containing protein [Coriobacteriia bacterium]